MKKTLTSSGSKDYQRADSQDRSLEYKMYHRNLGPSLIAADIDLIEWRFVDGKMKAVAVCEITRVDGDIPVTRKYLSAILQRYRVRDLQARMVCKVAEQLSTNAYIILYRQDCKEFWVYNLSQNKGWWYLNDKKYKSWLEGVGQNE